VLLNGHNTDVDTVRDLLRRRAELGNKRLLIVDDEALSYRQADTLSNALGNALRQLGVAKGDVVASYLYNCTDHFVLWMACVKIGAIWAPLNISLVGDDLSLALASCAPGAVVVDGELFDIYTAAGAADAGIRVVRGDARAGAPGWLSLAELIAYPDQDEPGVTIDSGDPVALIFTGGTTGLPKGVLLSSTYCLAGALRYHEMFAPGSTDVHIGVGQMFHAIGSVLDILCPMYWGMTTVLTRWFSATRFWPTVRRHHATVSVLLSAVIVALLARDPAGDDAANSLRIAGSVTGGMDPARVAEFASRFQVRLLELYGQTETGAPCCVGQRVDDPPFESQGAPHGWADIAVIDPRGFPCATGEEGEIVLRMTEPGTFMSGYHNAAALYEERCRDLWFHTGDTGYLDERGNLHFAGRQAHKIRRRGENVSAYEVEQVILELKGVEECVVVGVPVGDGDEAVKAVICPSALGPPDPGDVISHCVARLAYFKVPRYVQFVPSLPRSSAKGEVLRHVLKAEGAGDSWDRESFGVEVRNQAFRPAGQ
jgi:crotonobetaine/carnitine-CoA ligase